MIYLAVFIAVGGRVIRDENGEADHVEIGNYENEDIAIQQAESKLEANHSHKGVCFLKEKTKTRFGFIVVPFNKYVEEYKPQ